MDRSAEGIKGKPDSAYDRSKTYKQIAAENGKDWRDQIDDLAEVIEYANEQGLDMKQILFGQAPVDTGGDDTDGETEKGAR